MNVIPAIVTPERRAYVAQQAFDWLKEKNTKDNFNEIYSEIPNGSGVQFTFLSNNNNDTSTFGQNKNAGTFESTEQKQTPKHNELVNGQRFDMNALQARQNHQVSVSKGQDPRQLSVKVKNTSFDENEYYKKLNEPNYEIQRPNTGGHDLPPQLQPQKIDKQSNQSMIDSQYQRLMQTRGYQGGQQMGNQMGGQRPMGQQMSVSNRPEFGPNYQQPRYNQPQFVQ